MFFDVLERYCKEVLDCMPCDLFGFSKQQWHKYKKVNQLPLKHCKFICSHFECHLTDDLEELSYIGLTTYYRGVK
jgi:DNA-binding Xre family transcriptional regulator